MPSGDTTDGGYHSHPNEPNFDPAYSPERFSGQVGDAPGDMQWSAYWGIPLSLGTPGAMIIIYYPPQGNQNGCQTYIVGSPQGTGTTIPVCQYEETDES